MRLVHTLLLLLREDSFPQDKDMIERCLRSLEKSSYKTVVVFNQGYMDNVELNEYLKAFSLNFCIIGAGTNEGIVAGRQSCFEYIYERFPEAEYISELHPDMIFASNWEDALVEYLDSNANEPVISCGITSDLEILSRPHDSTDEYLFAFIADRVEPGFFHPCVHRAKVLKAVGGYDARFLTGKQAFEDDSLLVGYHYYYGTHANWRPKVNFNSVVFHRVGGQRFGIKENLFANFDGLVRQYGVKGIGALANIHVNPWQKNFFADKFNSMAYVSSRRTNQEHMRSINISDIKLSVIIPYYKETPEELFPVLSVINGQMGIDFSKIECLLVNDGAGNIPSNGFLSLFKNLYIRNLQLDENKGPGMARQLGIDNANGEYVMFCDADDSLSGVFVFNGFLAEIETNRPEVIFSAWLEEHYDEEKKLYQYSQHDVDFTWMHGKAFRRTFLEEKKIRFHKKLRIHEDNYFMALVFSESEDIRRINAMTYVWRAREDSTTRRNNAAFIYETIPEFCESTGYVLEEIERRHPEQLPTAVTQGIINVYFILHRKEWRTESRKALLKEAETAFGSMIKPYFPYFEKMPDSVIASMYSKERAVSFANEIETERLESWVKRITASSGVPRTAEVR